MGEAVVSDSELGFGEPDFEDPALMLVTYVCSVCGLRDRAQIERKAD